MVGRSLASILAFALVATSVSTSRVLHDARPRHLILIVVDTLRRDHVSAYGGRVPTPNIDRLAARGQRFTNVLASFHQTSMSMGALFSGRTPSLESGRRAEPLHWNGRHWCGLARFAEGADDPCLPPSLPTLAEAMREAGYRTVAVVSNEFLYRPAGFDRGFDVWREVGESPTGAADDGFAAKRARAAAHVNRSVGAVLDREVSAPLFLYVHYMDAHDWDLHGSYAEAVVVQDRGIGALLADLSRRGVLDAARVVLTADHGEALGEQHALPGTHGHVGDPSFEPLLEIPLIVAPPVGIESSRFLRTEDVFRLLRRWAGLAGGRGRDLERDELYLSEASYQTYRQGRWKSMRRRASGALHLFDLDADPGEERNVALRHADIARRHVHRLGEIERTLAASGVRSTTLSESDAARLKVLGYLQ